MQIAIIIATILISAVVFIPVGVQIRKKIAESKIEGAENEELLENKIVKVKIESTYKEGLIGKISKM